VTGTARQIPFLDRLRGAPSVATFLETVPPAGSPAILRGVAGSLNGVLAAMHFAKHRAQTVIVCGDADTASDVWNDASLLIADEDLLFLGQTAAAARMTASLDNIFAEQADVLRSLTERPGRLLVTDAASALIEYPSARAIREHSIRLEFFMALRQEDFVKRLGFGGFERTDFVGASGEYAVRGGIVDVFPIGFDNPLRVEFLGDIIESIREFDALNQRSIRQLESVGFVTSLFLEEDSARSTGTLFDFLSNDAVLFLQDEERIRAEAERHGRAEDFDMALALFSCFSIPLLPPGRSKTIDIGGEQQPAFNGSVTMLQQYLAELDAARTETYLVADSEQQARRLDELLQTPAEGEESLLPAARRTVWHCPLSRGFTLPSVHLAVVTEHQIFNRRRIQKTAKKGAKGLSMREIHQLKPGDYVVHVDKGIGKFTGLTTITVNGGLQETAKVLYAGDDVLYVNLNYINRLQKYSSEEGHAPSLSKLGSGEWDRLRERTKRRLKDIARDLIALYAKRKAAKGHAFPADHQWQKEMEASFIYEDTPDQYQATLDVKRDMESSTPMDRLVCGDVGYGKTEVALRAAFKAVLDAKQVAVLVPTTILAQQHFNTFQDRLRRYSVTVEALSRFKTAAEQKEVIARLATGKIDIIIGTHRLLSKDVHFRDLGLLIIDEEHRFGVAAKEKLRHLREEVDTIALTATPIPRTLNFSLLGARDLSVIETPPKNRLPVITGILRMERDVIAEGIARELERDGQVYFVNDRISDLDLLADKIRTYAPGVRIGIAHGQMKAGELEHVMMRFMERKVDVLVTTKIIESGLDIPNANTIFINRAERFGLAELYQLRGRVGRSNTQAYAYFLVPPAQKISRDALKRLQAIEEFSDLGSGFHLAMRDLEIRGAGNMLGAEQSGFIAEIGFELYLATIEEAVGELKTEEFGALFADVAAAPKKPRADVVMELGLDAYLPNTYVFNSTERFDLYKRLYNADASKDIDTIASEIVDRFGAMPEESQNMLTVVRLRLLASRIRFARVSFEKPRLVLAFPPESDTEFYDRHLRPIAEWMHAHPGTSLEQDARQVRLIVPGTLTLDAIDGVLRELLAVCNPEPPEDDGATASV
jgi:transcription-repair coupling factor (superfamily II helicase)